MIKKIATGLVIIYCACLNVKAQTPVNMSAQSNFTYLETFSDIANWNFNASPVDGTFSSGIGASAWKGNATNATGTIPDGKKITAATTGFVTQSTGGVQIGTGNLVLLSTGTGDNSSSTAIDFFMDFTGLSAGTLSFDWSSINNGTGNRKASLRVYSSTDGNTFTEITAAQVLNFTNNVVTYGSITNVNLPSSFNGSSTARLRFYFYNGTGGSTGSRPKLSIDNVKVTAVSSNVCTTPANQPTGIVFGTPTSTSISGTFTAAASAPDHYLVLASNNSGLSALPVNGTVYNPGDNIGDAAVVSLNTSTNFTANSLSPLTAYYFYVFSVNEQCSGGPLYQTVTPLTATISTATDQVVCSAPSAQPTGLVFSNITYNSLQGSFTGSSGTDEYLVVRNSSATLSSSPVNGTVYNAGDALGGGVVVSRGATTNFASNSLTAATTYYYFVFALNSNCTGGVKYNTANALTTSVSTVTGGVSCSSPTYQPGNLVTTKDNTTISGSFSNAVDADSYLVLYSLSPSLSQQPQNNIDYTVGTSLGNATVAAVTAANSFSISNLTASTTYYLFVYAKNSSCSGGVKYNITNPLSSSVTTNASGSYNLYFGNLHAHSHYSDGNKDNATYTPADDYAYAKNSLGMDFLGISEHNHSGAGMNVSDWPLGIAQANAATTSNFLALYGQEWGVISNGGHVLIYGIDSLIGWETNNYQVFVAKSDYTGTLSTTGTVGLFRLLNQNGAAFASYAHPNSSDYNNISNLPFNATVDSAVIGCAIESGPAFSTNTSYSDYPSSLGFLSYYTKMLSKGYHIGPFMDHDTHYTNFGRANENRLVVLAPSLTKANLFGAIKARHFYATEAISTRISFTINNQIMGSNFTGNSAPVINVTATDPANPSSVPLIKIMYGTPGSGVVASQLTSANASSLNYIDNSLVNGSTFYYYADITINGKHSITAPIWYTLSTCSLDNNNPISTWIGGNGTSTTTASNWCSGVVPPSGSNIIISSTATTMPVLTNGQIFSVNNLTIQSGSSFTLNGGTLAIAGVLSNNGTLDASTGTLTYTGSSAQVISSVGSTIQNLTVNNSAGVSINSAVTVTGTITPTAGTLTTNGNLTLASTASGTASIAQGSGSYLNGNVRVQRYVGTSQQWRMIGFPFTAATTISQTALAAFYTSTYSAYRFNEPGDNGAYNGLGGVNAGWNQFSSGTITADKGLLLTGGTIPTTINFSGALNTGTTTVTLSSTTGKGWNLVSNPFASNITWSTVQAASTNVDATVYRYNPTTTSYTAYNATTSTSSDGNQTNIIENGAGFFVHVTTPGNAASLSVTEAAKTAAAPGSSLFGIQPIGRNIINDDGANNAASGNADNQSAIRLVILKNGETNGGDAVVIRWGGGYAATDNFDPQYDAYDLGRANGVNLSILDANKTSYSIFHGSALLSKEKEHREVLLAVNNLSEGIYTINTSLLSHVFGDNNVYLVDHYTNDATLISADSNSYTFSVTANAGSFAENRFSIVLNYKPSTVINSASVMLINNPSSINSFGLITNADYEKLVWQLVDNSGRIIQSGIFGKVLKGVVYTVQTQELKAGSFLIKLSGDSNILPTQKWIKL